MTTTIDVCRLDDLPPSTMRMVEWQDVEILVSNCGGTLFALENRCSHDDGPLDEGTLDPQTCTIECPRHGSVFDLRSGRPLNLPAYLPVETYRVITDGGQVRIEVD